MKNWEQVVERGVRMGNRGDIRNGKADPMCDVGTVGWGFFLFGFLDFRGCRC